MYNITLLEVGCKLSPLRIRCKFSLSFQALALPYLFLMLVSLFVSLPLGILVPFITAHMFLYVEEQHESFMW